MTDKEILDNKPPEVKDAVARFIKKIPSCITGPIREAVICYYAAGYVAALMDKEEKE